MKVNFLYYLGVVVLMTSCASKQKMIYLQGIEQTATSEVVNYEPKIQLDDLIYINVSSESMEAAAPFNFGGAVQQTAAGNAVQYSSYLVDNQGYISLPIIGSVKVAGLTKTELHDFLKIKLEEYLKDPILMVRVINFKVTVMGEVKSPGNFTINSDRLTIMEALAQAGDLTPVANRENVLVVREESGIKSYYRVNLTDSEVLKSPIYYLKQNDLIIVEPRFTKPESSVVGANLPITLSVISLLLTITILATR
ncbi:polysaccharide biosynthesis/export family protein [Flavobacterium lacus]|uniref:Polysaccharide export outer membrane protein n=1 Tax=Flavobacterium lacus TaxID=1353778 RepID=A0A328X197_9FLAO|nr:polysaccharide biosynthesis/export family protein [Flavobacterium lacus]RAR51126.1 polysaccharide export outer membrane protein [Flavobacterium lacus]